LKIRIKYRYQKIATDKNQKKYQQQKIYPKYTKKGPEKKYKNRAKIRQINWGKKLFILP